MLEVRVGHERRHAVENSRRREHSFALRVEGHPRLKRQNDKSIHEKQGIEDEQGRRVLLPILLATIQPLFDPPQHSRCPVLSLHDPRHIAA